MSQKYSNLIQDLQFTKRELNNYKLKSNNLQTQILSSQNDITSLKMTIQNLKQTNQKLTHQNSKLLKEKQQLINSFNQNIQAIKGEVNRKQEQILNYQTKNAIQINMGQQFYKKQIYYQIEQQFQEKYKIKDQKIQQLMKNIQRIKHQTKLQKQKFDYKTQQLQKQIKNLQNQHLLQIQQYADQVYLQSKKKYNSQEQSLLKKLRRQIDQLRKTIDLKSQQLQLIILQNKAIKQQHNQYVAKQSIQMDKAVNQVRGYRKQCQRLSQNGKKNVIQRDNQMLRDKQKQIKRLKNQIEDLNQDISRRDRQNQKILVQNAQLTGQIKKIKQIADRDFDQKIRKMKGQRDMIEKQLNNMKLSYGLLKDQNMDLVKTMNNINSNNNMMFKSSSQQNNNTNHYIKQQNKILNKNSRSQINLHKVNGSQFNLQQQQKMYRQHDQQIRKSIQAFNKMKSQNICMIATQDKHIQEVQFNQKLEQQRQKVRDIARKYLQMKQKYQKAKDKLQIANAKIIQLLRTKVALGSPTAASKKTFQFTDQKISKVRQQQTIMDPQQIQYNRVNQLRRQKQRQNQLLHQDFYQAGTGGSQQNENNLRIEINDQYDNNIRNNGLSRVHQNIHMRSLNQLSRHLISPKNENVKTNEHFNQQKNPHKYYQKANRTISSGSKQFYERSLKIRSNHKFKELKCQNHSIKDQN